MKLFCQGGPSDGKEIVWDKDYLPRYILVPDPLPPPLWNVEPISEVAFKASSYEVRGNRLIFVNT